MAQQRRRKPSLVKSPQPPNDSTPQQKLESLVQERIDEMIKDLTPKQAAELIPEIDKRMSAMLQSDGGSSALALADSFDANPLPSNALNAGMDALRRATELPFPEFTAKLVTSTFDAVVGATIHQMEAYGKLVADLAKTIKDFEASNVNDAEIFNYLAGRYPDGSGGTSVRDDYTFAAGADLGKVFFDLVEGQLASIWTGPAASTGEFPRPDDPAGYSTADPSQTTATNFTAAQILALHKAVRRLLAKGQLDILRMMAQDGMSRIEVTDGRIRSKLTFHVATTDEQARSAANAQQHQMSGGGTISVKTKWFGINAGQTHSSLAVRVVNDRTFSKVTMDAELVGEVDLRIQSFKFPPVNKVN